MRSEELIPPAESGSSICSSLLKSSTGFYTTSNLPTPWFFASFLDLHLRAKFVTHYLVNP